MLQIEWISASTLTEVALVLMAFVLSAIIGLERARRSKSAGMRTHTLVGLGAAVFTLVSSYGFSTVIGHDVVLDPSRIAAQIVSGIGFLGAGVIFVRRNAVTGLTTAASIWVVAAIGMACGSGMPLLALLATALHLCAVRGLTPIRRWLATHDNDRTFALQYKDGHAALRSVLMAAAQMGLEPLVADIRSIDRKGKPPYVRATLEFKNLTMSTSQVAERLMNTDGVVSVMLIDDETE